MPAPHDKRFLKMYHKAQIAELMTDTELLGHYEGSLEQVTENMPDIPEDKAVHKALRSWARFLFPNEDLPRCLRYDRELDFIPKYGHAVVVPSSAPGTFCWNNITNEVQWAWFSANPRINGPLQATDLEEEKDKIDGSNMAPSSNNNENGSTLGLNSLSLNGTISIGPYESKIIEVRFNEYWPLEPFVTAKALKAGFTQEELDDGWTKSSDQSWERFGDHGMAYVQYMAEASYWCAMCGWTYLPLVSHANLCEVKDEVFPGRNPITGDYHMYTHTEMIQNPELCFKEPELLARSRTPSESPERSMKRARASTTNSE